MQFNSKTEFDLHDYLLLKISVEENGKKLDKVEDEITQMLPEKSTGNSVTLDRGVTGIIDIICFSIIETDTPTFSTSAGMTIVRRSDNYPAFIEKVSHMTIVYTDMGGITGFKGQIDWNGCIYELDTDDTNVDSYTLTLPEEFTYHIIKNYY